MYVVFLPSPVETFAYDVPVGDCNFDFAQFGDKDGFGEPGSVEY